MQIYYNNNIGKYSWFKTGGNAEIFAIIENVEELQSLIHKYDNKDITILGAGSNCLIRDGGINGLVIKLAGDFLKIDILNKSNASINNDDICFVKAGSAVLSAKLSNFFISNNLIGGEFLDTIPGSVGGMIITNAGCFGGEIKDILLSADLLINNHIDTYANKDLCFQYRKSQVPKNAVIMSATFKFKIGNENDMRLAQEKIKQMREKRKQNQIVGLTCGSTFANPEGYSAWELIDKVGLRGYKIGGAMFSEKHCNFIVNFNNAKAQDIENLIELAKQRVLDKFGIELKTEIRILGKK